jgi:hypothetical protein
MHPNAYRRNFFTWASFLPGHKLLIVAVPISRDIPAIVKDYIPFLMACLGGGGF